MPFHDTTLKEIYQQLKTGEQGLSSFEVKKRLEEYGKNEIEEKDKIRAFDIFLSQFKSPLIIILIAAVLISFTIGETIDALVISIILVLNAVLGFTQEYKAEKAIEALKKLTSLKAVVIRDKKEVEIDAIELVPGDIILLETGDKIPADSRLIEAINLDTQEASLTGESNPVIKEICVLKEATLIADRKNSIFSGTIITRGRGKAIVHSTGMNTQIGKIAKMIQEETKSLTPLQLQLKGLSKVLGLLVLAVCIIVFLAGILKGEPVLMMLLAAVALAVAAIPEGLPAVVTMSLALGIRRMIQRNVLIRKLPSVETLGCVTVICADKTGTLTKNEMTVRKLFVNGEIVDVTGTGYDSKGEFSLNPRAFELMLSIGALCNDAKIEPSPMGDPTELALIVSAGKAGLIKDELELQYPRVEEIPFDSERKRMITIHKVKNKKLAFMKGAPDIIIDLCNKLYIKGNVKPLTKHEKEKILKINEKFAGEALRVLGFAYKEVKGKADEKDMIFVGLQAMIDPPRDEVKGAIEKCKKAGIKVVIVTGDQKPTAVAVANTVGLDGQVITGAELDALSDEDFEKCVEKISIYARVNPEHKLKIVKALEAKKEVVAMTGDGVNDAPAMKKANIGISMGIKGTDVAKEASDMILTDDNFASIVNAVEEGRAIYDNIRKFVYYLLSSNLGEILVIFVAILIGMPLPLIAIQILWINLVTDGFPALALGVDPPAPNIMERPPRKRTSNIVNSHAAFFMFFIGIVMMLGTLYVFKYYLANSDLNYARTMAFSTLMMFQIFNVFNAKADTESIFKVGFFSNKWLIAAILSSILLQVAVIHTSLNTYFGSVPISIIDWAYVVLISSSVLIFIELDKIFKKLFKVRVQQQ